MVLGLLVNSELLLEGLVMVVGIERIPVLGLASVVTIFGGSSATGLSVIMLPITSGSLLASVYGSVVRSMPAAAMLWWRSSKLTEGRKSCVEAEAFCSSPDGS